jgi:DNA-binding transcriptional MerR regulator
MTKRELFLQFCSKLETTLDDIKVAVEQLEEFERAFEANAHHRDLRVLSDSVESEKTANEETNSAIDSKLENIHKEILQNQLEIVDEKKNLFKLKQELHTIKNKV